MRYSVIIPVYNEELLLKQEITKLIGQLNKLPKSEVSPQFEILICENGSTDNTLKYAGEMSGEFSTIRVISSPSVCYGKAVKNGIIEARGEWIVMFNIDFWDCEILRKAEPILDKFDIILGSKLAQGSKDKRPLLRKMITKVFSFFLRKTLRTKCSDTHGIKLLKRSKIIKMVKECQTENEIFDTELILRSEKEGLRICEFPVEVKEIRPPRRGLLKRVPRTAIDIVRVVKSLRGNSLPVRREISRSKRLFYDGIADRFDSIMNKYDLEKRLNIVFEEFLSGKNLKDKLLLDIGCGTGWFSSYARNKNAHVVSVDIGLGLLNEVKKKCNTTCVLTDAMESGFGNEKFDIIICSEVIEHTYNPSKVVSELSRMLKRRGSLIITVPNKIWSFSLWVAKLMGRPYEGYENWVGWFEIKKWFKDNGLRITAMKGFHSLPFVSPHIYSLIDFLDKKMVRLGPLMLNIGVMGEKR